MARNFDEAVSAELVRLTLGGKPERPELQYNKEPRCNLSDLYVSQCSHCLYAERTLSPAHTHYYEDGGE